MILVRRETNPDDLKGMIAADGILTARGGKTSHAAVVARGMGKTCVCGAEALDVDAAARSARDRRRTVLARATSSRIDGTTGEVFLGDVPVVDSPVATYLETGSSRAGRRRRAHRRLVHAVDRVLQHADATRRMRRAGQRRHRRGRPPGPARGAEGSACAAPSTCSSATAGEFIERLILAADRRRAARRALERLLPLQRQDFVELLAAMDGLPMTIRLIDPPLHEFLPDLTELAVGRRRRGRRHLDPTDERPARGRRADARENPMLGLRGVRLGLDVPGLFALQVRAIAEATAQLRAAGGRPAARDHGPARRVGAGAAARPRGGRRDPRRGRRRVRGRARRIPIGCMIELPRAALTAHRIAEEADFFSFGTNDLTQTTWGFSRDDVEGAFFANYLEHGVLTISPFETLDADGVGALVQSPSPTAARTRPDLKLGVCGEHGGDPESIHFFHERRASTTSPARRSGSPSPASRPVAPPSSAPDPPPCRRSRGSRAAVPWQGFGSGWQWDGSGGSVASRRLRATADPPWR